MPADGGGQSCLTLTKWLIGPIHRGRSDSTPRRCRPRHRPPIPKWLALTATTLTTSSWLFPSSRPARFSSTRSGPSWAKSKCTGTLPTPPMTTRGTTGTTRPTTRASLGLGGDHWSGSRRTRLRDPIASQAALAASRSINTSFVQRHHVIDRRRNARKTRQTETKDMQSAARTAPKSSQRECPETVGRFGQTTPRFNTTRRTLTAMRRR